MWPVDPWGYAVGIETAGEMIHPDDIEFKLVSDLIESRFGLVFDTGRAGILKSQLACRIDALNLESFTDYYHYLSHHPDRTPELGELARQITNGESYFFREHHHFDILKEHLAPRHHARSPRDPLRVLSAGCSAGQEAYSIAITLHEAGNVLGTAGWKVDACDIHPDRLAQARSALYGEVSLRTCRGADRRLYFENDGERYRVRPEYRNRVRFFTANLTDPAAADWGRYNVIFCRNVLIYFSDDAFQEAVDQFFRCLLPGGYLFLGHSESLINRRDDFEPVSMGGYIVYRKREAGPSSVYS